MKFDSTLVNVQGKEIVIEENETIVDDSEN